ncbi:MAG: aldo/keto reductase [Hyphomicrobiaceae bacterium]
MTRAPTLTAHGATIPRIGLGTWPMKGEECSKAVVSALAAGYRHIDTAAMYGNEADVGAGIKAGGVPRDEIFVTTKVWWENIGDGALQRSAEESLAKLGLSDVNLLLIHWPSKTIPLADSIRALNDAKRRGLARNIGISNFPTKLIDQAMQLTKEPIVCNQVEYHPHLDQTKVLAACRRHGLAVVAYCPLGRGNVGGVLEEPAVKAIAARLGRTAGQVVMRWHMQQPGVIAVPKSATPSRIAENLDVFGFELSDADMAALSGLAKPNGRVVNLAFAPEWD